MKRAYLFLYNSEVGTREKLRELIDQMPEVSNWLYELPYCFYLVSELSAHDLAYRLRAVTGGKGRFLVTEVGTNKQGWLPPASWRFLNEKPNPGEDPGA
jgi:hypothetical protein